MVHARQRSHHGGHSFRAGDYQALRQDIALRHLVPQQAVILTAFPDGGEWRGELSGPQGEIRPQHAPRDLGHLSRLAWFASTISRGD